MKRLLALTSVLVLMVCSGCGDSQESLAGESLASMKELIATFDGIKDVASAKSAKPKLKTLFEKMNSINERQKKLGIPDEAQFKAMQAKYGTEMEDLQMKMASNMMRISLNPAIRAELDDLDQVMRKPAK